MDKGIRREVGDWNREGGGLARREGGGQLVAQVEAWLEPSMELIWPHQWTKGLGGKLENGTE